jgi:hypothetical protein
MTVSMQASMELERLPQQRHSFRCCLAFGREFREIMQHRRSRRIGFPALLAEQRQRCFEMGARLGILTARQEHFADRVPQARLNSRVYADFITMSAPRA